MQDEMSRFEAEISGAKPPLPPPLRPIIGSSTFGNVQQQLEAGGAPVLGGVVPAPPPPPLISQFTPPMLPAVMFGGIPPPPPPPSLLIPSQVQRLRPPEVPPMGPFPPGPPAFLRPPGPPPAPPKPQPVVLSSAPQLYKTKTSTTDAEKAAKRADAPTITASLNSPAPPPPKQARVEPEISPAVEQVPPANSINTDHSQSANKGGKKEKKNKKLVRTAGGIVWEDSTLMEWADDDFRLFCGDLGNDVTDELLIRTFSKYSSFQKAKVVRDKRTNKSKGFGFISFKEPGDFIKAMKEMNGRYVGSRPIKLHKSTWKNRALDVVRKKEKEKAALLALLTSGNKV